MSLFETQTVACPSCGGSVSFDVVHSVNVDRKPELRDQILDESFQRKTCPGCEHVFRMEPEFTYLDIGRRLWLGCWQSSRLEEWERWAAQAQTSYDKAFGKLAPASARQIGDELRVRVTFGWSALREKIIALENDLSDVTLELVKATILAQEGAGEEALDGDLRLVNLDDETLVFAWVDRNTGMRSGQFSVERSIVGGVESAAEAFAALRTEVDGGMHVDLQRTLLAPAQAAG